MSQQQTSTQPSSVGVILPPNEIRKIADKTAEFVAKNGSSFEELVIQQEAKNSKFSFLKRDDPYRAYYDSMVAEFQRPLIEKKIQQLASQMSNQTNDASSLENLQQQQQQASTSESQQSVLSQKISHQLPNPLLQPPKSLISQNIMPSLLPGLTLNNINIIQQLNNNSNINNTNTQPPSQLQQSLLSQQTQWPQLLQQSQQQQQLQSTISSTSTNINFTQQSQIKKEIQQQTQQKELKPPPPDQFTVKAPKGISQLDLDVIKHTAQFVAKNGNKFLIELTEREKFNPQFDFVKPNHSLFYFFTSLIDAYSKCIIPKNPDLKNLQESITDRNILLQRLTDRFDYESNQFEQKKKKEDMDNEERLQLQQIDWSDFVVVETIDLFDNEDLPAPALLDKNKLNPLLQNKLQNTNLNDLLQKDIDEKQNLSQQQQQQLKSQPSLPQQPQQQQQQQQSQQQQLQVQQQQQQSQLQIGPQVRPVEITSEPTTNLQNQLNIDQIKALQEMENNAMIQQQKRMMMPELQQQQQQGGPQEMVKCQVCGNNIPASEYNEHIRIELLDPKYKDIKNQVEQRAVNTTQSTSVEFQSSLSQFAKRRPDIFGSVEEQLTQTGAKKNQKEAQKGWDGQSETMTRTTASIAMLAQQQKKTIEENMKLNQQEEVEEKQLQQQQQQQQLQKPSLLLPLQQQQQQSIQMLNPLMQPPLQQQPPLIGQQHSLIGQPPTNIQQQQATAPTLFMPPNPLQQLHQQPLQIPMPMLNQQQQQQQPPQQIIPKPLVPGIPMPGINNQTQQQQIKLPTQQNIAPPIIPQIGNVGVSSVMAPQQGVLPLITPPPQNILGGLLSKPQNLVPMPTPLLMNNTNKINTTINNANQQISQLPQELNLIQEQEWLDKHPETIQINIKIPATGGEDSWTFKGQTIQASLDPNQQIQAIKNIIADSLNMPQSKQKLKFKGNVLKDNKSLAFYNLLNGCPIELTVKERGGKKK